MESDALLVGLPIAQVQLCDVQKISAWVSIVDNEMISTVNGTMTPLAAKLARGLV